MSLDMKLRESGEFRVVRHTGHTYDDEGREIHGEIIEESAWGRNLITSVGLDAELNNASVYVNIVVGAGNTAPTISNTTLQSYKGKRTTQIQYSRVVNVTPDAEGYCTITTIYRATFNPGSLGSGAANISEAGTAMAPLAYVSAATNLFSRGLLVDALENPLTISMNASTEYLDVYWRHIRYIPAEITGSQSLSIMGVSVVHSFTIRPYMFSPVAAPNYHASWWTPGAADSIAGLAPTTTDPYNSVYYAGRVFDGSISADIGSGVPTGTPARYTGSSWTFDPYVTGSASRKCKLNLIPTEGNFAAGIKSLTLQMGLQGWQVQISPVIMKNATPARVLRLDFTVSLANKT